MGDCISAPSTMIPFSLGLDLPKGKIKGTRNVQSQKEIGPDVSYTYRHDHTTTMSLCSPMINVFCYISHGQVGANGSTPIGES